MALAGSKRFLNSFIVLMCAYFTFTFSSRLQAAGVFACRGAVSRLIILGETHEYPSVKVLRHIAMHKAARGDIHLALEGTLPEEMKAVYDKMTEVGVQNVKREFIHPMESPHQFSLAQLLALEVTTYLEAKLRSEGKAQPFHKQISMGYLMGLLADLSKPNSFSREAWNSMKLRRPFEDSELEEVASLIDRAIDLTEKLRAVNPEVSLIQPSFESFQYMAEDDINRLVNIGETDDLESFLLALINLRQEYVFMLQSPKYKDPLKTPDRLSELMEVTFNQSIYDFVLLDWRNEEIARNLARAYQAAQKSDVNLVGFFGGNHVSGIVSDSNLQGIPLRSIDIRTWLDEQTADLRASLKSPDMPDWVHKLSEEKHFVEALRVLAAVTELFPAGFKPELRMAFVNGRLHIALMYPVRLEAKMIKDGRIEEWATSVGEVTKQIHLMKQEFSGVTNFMDVLHLADVFRNFETRVLGGFTVSQDELVAPTNPIPY